MTNPDIHGNGKDPAKDGCMTMVVVAVSLLHVLRATYMNLIGVPWTQGYMASPLPDFIGFFLPLLYCELKYGRVEDPAMTTFMWVLFYAFLIQRAGAFIARGRNVATHSQYVGTTWGGWLCQSRLGTCLVNGSLMAAGYALAASYSAILAEYLIVLYVGGLIGLALLEVRHRREGDIAFDGTIEGKQVARHLQQRLGGR